MSKQRKDVLEKDTWNTSDLFKTEKLWVDSLEYCENALNEVASYKGLLNNEIKLKEFFDVYEDLAKRFESVYQYASLNSDVDVSDSHHSSNLEKAKSLSVKFSKKLAFFNVELLEISEERFNEMYLLNKELLKYQRVINDITRSRNHILSAKEEDILAATRLILDSASDTFMTLNDADMKYQDAIDSDGKSYPLTSGSYINIMTSDDRNLRKDAYNKFYQEYQNLNTTMASLLFNHNKALKFSSEVRKYESPLVASLHNTNVPVSVYHNLIKTVHSKINVLHKYMNLRKRVLKLDKLNMYDLYVPIVEKCNIDIPYDTAVNNVLESIKVLGDDYYNVLKKGFESRWVDVYENIGKRSGAYSSGGNLHPFVLMNYQNDLNTEFTLAHEMGHAMHSYLSNKNQNYLDSDYVIFVAEVASTCNEALLMDYLNKNNTDKKFKAYLINYFLEQFRTTLYRQTMFAEFEMIISELNQKNIPLTKELLNSEYRKLNEFYYGSDVIIDDNISIEWSRIPHFYYDFYVFQYATGFSAAMSLSKKILTKDQNAINDYLNFLKGGCSKTPIDLLKGAGCDMSSPKPIEEALDLFNSLIDELEEILL